MATSERWPPVYDFEELIKSINDQVKRQTLLKGFYATPLRLGAARICQGDVVRLPARLPLLDKLGQPAIGEDVDLWMVAGNTCDLARDLADAEWTFLMPVQDIGGPAEVPAPVLERLTGYRGFRQFYLPAWPNGPEKHFAAELSQPVTVHKDALLNVADVQARMSFEAWALLNACLVRFLARDDGRFDS